MVKLLIIVKYSVRKKKKIRNIGKYCLHKADEKELSGGKSYKILSLKDIYFMAKGN